MQVSLRPEETRKHDGPNAAVRIGNDERARSVGDRLHARLSRITSRRPHGIGRTAIREVFQRKDRLLRGIPQIGSSSRQSTWPRSPAASSSARRRNATLIARSAERATVSPLRSLQTPTRARVARRRCRRPDRLLRAR